MGRDPRADPGVRHRGGPTRPVPPPRVPHHLSASYDSAPRKGARPGSRPLAEKAAGAGHRPSVRCGPRPGHTRPGRSAIVADVATGRADAAEYTHVPGLVSGAGHHQWHRAQKRDDTRDHRLSRHPWLAPL